MITPSPVYCFSTASTATTISYCETIATTNPLRRTAAAAKWLLLPWGSINLARFVTDPFTAEAKFDEAGFATDPGCRAHARQRTRRDGLAAAAATWAMNKRHRSWLYRAWRRVDHVLNLADAAEARAMATNLELMRDTALRAPPSVDLAKERGAFPLFNADLYLSAPTFASRPAEQTEDRKSARRVSAIPPAVDCADWHHQPGVCRQRQ